MSTIPRPLDSPRIWLATIPLTPIPWNLAGIGICRCPSVMDLSRPAIRSNRIRRSQRLLCTPEQAPRRLPFLWLRFGKVPRTRFCVRRLFNPAAAFSRHSARPRPPRKCFAGCSAKRSNSCRVRLVPHRQSSSC